MAIFGFVCIVCCVWCSINRCSGYSINRVKMALTLVTYPGNFRAFKALIAAEYAGVEIAVKDVDAKAAAKLSPTGKVPVLETPQGTIFESNAIARYVARLRSDADLYGRTFYESAVHRSAQIKFRGAL